MIPYSAPFPRLAGTTAPDARTVKFRRRPPTLSRRELQRLIADMID